MVKQAQVEINKFVGGLFTDASPLTYPDNTSSVDINMELNTDGSRQRALGINYEDNHESINSFVTTSSVNDTAYNVYRWENVAGDPDKNIICVQFGNRVKFFDADSDAISRGYLDQKIFSSSPMDIKYSFTAVDGYLVVASGINLITIVTYTDGVFSYSTSTIKVRDFWGVEDKVNEYDFTEGQTVQKRPVSLTNRHLYNLRNQSFGIPRYIDNNEVLADPVKMWANKYPSNSDSVTAFLYADANDTNDRNTKRFFAKDLEKNPLGNFRAPMGYFIIDLLNRGESRLQADADNRDIYPKLTEQVTTLSQDRTKGGATTLAEFAGRVWYGGFSGELYGGDNKSPNLSSYVAFSQLVTDTSMITKCYQEGDPTSDTEPDIIDTDGGYIRISNAFGISSMINLGRNLFVGSSNGWWRIYGGNDSGFSATNYVVDRITDKGVRGSSTVVEVENGLMYWSDDGIYHIHTNDLGDWVADNLTQKRIQRLYDGIEIEVKEEAFGVYDSFQKKVRWLYNNSISNITQQKELVLDINLNAFYERHIGQINVGAPPMVVAGFVNNPYKARTFVDDVTVNNVLVTIGSEDVTITTSKRSSVNSLSEVSYVIVNRMETYIYYTFGGYTDTNWKDWKGYDNVGIDAEAVLVTGVMTGGDTMRYKQIPYLFVHMIRTENGFRLRTDGDYEPLNRSSCNVQSQWDWTNSSNSNKWGNPFQAYRYKRFYSASGVGDTYDTGYEVIVTKNKLRGRGRALSLKFYSSPGREMYILGWSFILSGNDNV